MPLSGVNEDTLDNLLNHCNHIIWDTRTALEPMSIDCEVFVQGYRVIAELMALRAVVLREKNTLREARYATRVASEV